MGKFAQSVGAHAVTVHQPIHPYQSAEGWVHYHAAIARELPENGSFYIRDASVSADMVNRRLTDEAPNIVGIRLRCPESCPIRRFGQTTWDWGD